MESRVFNRKNLLGFSMIVLFYHLAMTLVPWFIYSWPMFIVDYILLGIMASGWLLYWGWNRIFAKPKLVMIILIGFLVWLLISCMVMTVKWDNDWVGYNFIPMMTSPTAPGFNAAVTILFVFPLGIALAREKDVTILKLGKVLLHVFLLGWTVWMAVVLITVMQGKSMTAPSGGTIGMVSGSLELNCNQNITGSWEMTFFLLCCIMAIWCKKVPWKYVYGFAATTHYITLVLSNSRASIFATMPGFMALAGIAVFLKLGKKKTLHRVLWALLMALISGVAFFFLRRTVFALYNACIGQQSSGYTSAEFLTGGGSFHLSGREEVWAASVKGIFTDAHTMIFGVTPKSTSDLIRQASDGKVITSYTHNEFLEIAASMGLPGLALFLVWLGMAVRDTWRMYFIRKEWTLLLCVPVAATALLLANMMEAHLIFCEHLNGYVFFLLGGILYGAMNKPRKT